jgi:hypothetical protein
LSGAADADGDDRVSYQEIIAHVEQRLRDPRIDLPQKPELRTRRAFFAQPFLGRVLSSRGLPKVIDVADGVVTINRGGQHGIASRQTYEPARGEPSSDDGMIRIETVEQFIATGRIEGPLDVNSGDALRPVETQYRPGAIAVWIAPPVGVDDPPRWRARVGECLQDIAGVNLTDDPAAADRTILIEQKLGRISAALYSRYGTLRARREYSGVSELLDDLPKRVIGELLITQLARLESRDSDLHLRLWVEGDRTSFIAYQDEDKQETIRFGFRASADCYLTLISIDSIGEIRWNLLEPGFRARAGVEYSLPPKDEEPLYVFPPAGRDFVYALATPQPVETGRLGTKAVSQQGTGEAIDLLTRAIGRRQRRSTENQPSLEAVVQLARDGWGAALVTIDTLAEE